MDRSHSPPRAWTTHAWVAIHVFTLVLMTNLSAIIDALLHPHIPYFHDEHLIVGGVTGTLAAAGLALFTIRSRRLEAALHTIDRLSALLPMCSQCKRVRAEGADPTNRSSWQPIEVYVANEMRTEVSHGVCPHCVDALYPAYAERKRGGTAETPSG